jgi:hypothetical protein
VLVAELAQACEEPFRRHVDPALALYGLDEDGGGLRPRGLPRGFEVSEGYVDEALRQRPEALLQRGLGGGGEPAVGAPVERLAEGDDLMLLRAVVRVGVATGELYRGLDRFGAGVAEEHPVEVGGLDEHPRHLLLQRDAVEV